MNKPLLVQAINQIIQCPDSWNQKLWGCADCGSSHCIGGWIIVLSGSKVHSPNRQLTELLDLNYNEYDWLTSNLRNFDELYAFAKRYLAWEKMGRSIVTGLDQGGFNRNDRINGVDRYTAWHIKPSGRKPSEFPLLVA